MDVVNQFFEERAAQLLDLAKLVEKIFATANIDYCITGGLAIYLYVEEVAPDAGRLTKDVDIVVRHRDLARIAEAAKPFGLELQEGSVLVRSGQPRTRRAVHLLFVEENGIHRRVGGFPLVPLADLVRMKLTSFRAKDETHLKDLDEAGLLTPEIEASLPPELMSLLIQTRLR